MRIRIGALKSSLSEEISALEVKASDCRVWLEKMGSFDLSVFGLEGEGFRVLSSRVQDQGVYVRGFFLLVDAVRRGDEANRKAVGMLEPSEPDGSVDVDHLTYLAEGWRKVMGDQKRLLEEAEAGQHGQWGPVVAEGARRNIERYSVFLQEYERKLGKVVAYEKASESFYTEAESLSPVMGMMEAAMIAVCEGRVPDLSWQKDVDARWDKWVQANGDEIKSYMTDSQKKAFDKACEHGWQEADFYRGGKLNKDLWQGLARVPKWLLSSTIAAAAVCSQERILEHNDIALLQQIASWMYTPTGDKRVTSLLGVDASQNVNVKIYGYKKCGFLERMLEESNRFLSLQNPEERKSGTNPRWNTRLAINTLLHIENNVKPLMGSDQVYGKGKNGLEINIGYALDEGHPESSSRMFVVAVEPDMKVADDHFTSCIAPSFSPSVYRVYVGVSGRPSDAATFLHDLQNNEGMDKYNFFYSVGSSVLKVAVNEAVSRSIKNIPVIGKYLSQVTTVGKVVASIIDSAYSDWDGHERASRVNLLNRASTGMAENDLFTDSQFSMVFAGSSGNHEGDYTHPEARFILDDKAKVYVQKVINAYNKLHSTNYNLNKLQSVMAKNAFTLYDVNDHENQDTKKFLQWCRKPADLVYKRDCFDQVDGKYHKAGEEVRVPISNYQYVTKAYTVYTFAWDVR
ncbi:hypothetical protein [Scardovia wiggsiae]|uniref:hypothetical protein n=1 Tax=Scardovia wiggsiae TaxID=230143 RepID=UPI00374F9119